jgi:hypothetical protein
MLQNHVINKKIQKNVLKVCKLAKLAVILRPQIVAMYARECLI